MRRTSSKVIYDCKCPECGALHEYNFGQTLRDAEREPIGFDCDECARVKQAQREARQTMIEFIRKHGQANAEAWLAAAIRKVAEAEKGEGVI